MQFPTIVTLRTTEGREYTEEVLVNRGGPQDPLSDSEHAVKFSENVSGRLSSGAAEHVRDMVMRLTEVTDVAEMLAPLRHLVHAAR